MSELKYILSFLVLFSSCETIVEVDVPPVDEEISIHCLFSDVKYITIAHIGTVEPILNGNEPEYIEGADITIEINPLGEELILEETELGRYAEFFNTSILNGGEELSLKVSHPIYGDYETSQILPEKPIINSFNYEEVDIYDSFRGTRYNTLAFNFDDNNSTDDYYHVHAYIRNQCCENDYYSVWTWSLNPMLEETVSSQGLIFSDKSFNGNNLSLELNMDNTYINPDEHFIYLRFSKITADYYLHLKSQKNYEDAQSNPFAEPVTLHSNVEGAFGIFAVEATTFEFIQ